MKKKIESNKVPAAIGPYSQAIETEGLVFVAGQIGADKDGVMADGIEAQTKQSLTNIKYILEEAGLTMDNIVKTTVYLQHFSDFAKMNEVYATFFSGDCPARAAFEVVTLPKNGLVEIEAIATK